MVQRNFTLGTHVKIANFTLSVMVTVITIVSRNRNGNRNCDGTVSSNSTKNRHNKFTEWLHGTRLRQETGASLKL